MLKPLGFFLLRGCPFFAIKMAVPLAAARQEFGQQEGTEKVDLPRLAGASATSASLSRGQKVGEPEKLGTLGTGLSA